MVALYRFPYQTEKASRTWRTAPKRCGVAEDKMPNKRITEVLHESLGDTGRPKSAEDYIVARDLTRKKVIEAIKKLLDMTPTQLKSHMSDPEITMNEFLLGNLMVKCAEYGDTSRIDFLYNRLIGKVADKIDIHATATMNVNEILVDALQVHIANRKSLKNEKG